MKFRVINKPHGNTVAEGESLKEVAMSIDTIPFMIVATETVAEGEDYQAIQIKPDTVQINFKRGHRFVTANTIAEAYQAEEDNDGDDTKITVEFVSEYGDIPNSVIFDAEGGVIDELPNMEYDDEDYTYTFNGWKLGKKMVTVPLNVTKDMKLTADWTLTEKYKPVTYNFSSYAADKETKYADGTAKTLEPEENGKQKIEVLTNVPEDAENPFIGRVLYIDVAADENGFHQLYDETLAELPIFIKIN